MNILEKYFNSLLLILFSLTLGFIWGIYFTTDLSHIIFLIKNNSVIITAFATLLLVIVTAKYVFLTNKLISLKYEPLIIVSLKNIIGSGGRYYTKFSIQNLGSGPAYNIQFKLESDNGVYLKTNHNKLQIFDEGLKFLYPLQNKYYHFGETSIIERELEEFTITSMYEDKEYRHHETKSIISKNLIEQDYGVINVLEKLSDISGQINTVSDAIGSIKNSVDNLKKE